MLSEHEYHPLTVLDVVDETADTRSFVLEIPPALEATFAYAAGQFCTFRATIEGESVVRCYSMSSSPDVGERFTTAVKRVPGGRMSNWMNDSVAPGDELEVMRPTGLFVLRETDSPIVAFAGGSGITPVISIVKSALATTDREITLVYANRSGDAVIFGPELERLAASSGGRLSVHHHLDSERGFLDAPACAALVGEHTGADFYICGPGPYMDTVEAGLAIARGLAVPMLHRAVRRSRRHARRRRCHGDRVGHDPPAAPDPHRHVPARRHDPRDRAARRPATALLVRVGQLRHVHGAPRHRIGVDAGQQRAHARRGGGRLGADLPGRPDEPRDGRRLRRLNR